MTQEEFFKRYTYSIRTDKIGGGAFGTVYLAYDNIVNRYVAIKVSEVKTIGSKEFSLQDEFNALKNLPVHPNIANYETLYTFEMQNGIFDYAIMQYYKDGNIAAVIKQKLSIEQKEQLAIGLLEGIVHLHQHNIVHRDLKPSNVLVIKYKNKYIPVITDFGLSKQTSEEAKSRFTNSFAGGTLKYSSPEQLKGEILRQNTDLWSFAVMLYEIFTSKALFETTANSKISAEAEKDIFEQILSFDLNNKIKEVPDKWQKVLEVCLVRDVDKRIKSVEEISTIIFNNYNENKRNKEESKENTIITEQHTKTNEDRTKIEKTVLYKANKELDDEKTVIDETIKTKVSNTKNEKVKQKTIINKKKKIKRNTKFIALLVIVIIIALIFIFYSYKDNSWQNTQKQNTILAYKQYISDYPQGEYKDKAEENIVWLKAKQKNNTLSYSAFVNQYPQSKFLDTANNRIQKLQFDSILALNNTNALINYIQQYPQGSYASDANTKLIELVADSTNYIKAQQKHTEEAYNNYINNNPQGKYLSQAKKELQTIKKIETGQITGHFTDPRDGKIYKTIKIGKQTWFAENLNYTGNNGYQRHITDNNEWDYNNKYNAWCYYDNKVYNGNKYGALYQWEAAKHACPNGWHLPTDDEWQTLIDYLGGKNVAGGKLKATYGWENPNTGATNTSKFSALPSGYRYYNGLFYNLGNHGNWWSATEYNSYDAYYRRLSYGNAEVGRYGGHKSRGFSVRCVRD